MQTYLFPKNRPNCIQIGGTQRRGLAPFPQQIRIGALHVQRKGRSHVLPFPEPGGDSSPAQFLLPVDGMVDRSKFLGGGFRCGNGVLVTIRDLMHDAVEKVFYPVACQVP